MAKMFFYHVHLADGFSDDCDELIHRCSKREPLDFQIFCKIWKDMNFSCIYKGRSPPEIAELSEELLLIAKRYLTADTSNFEQTVAGLFLVYGLLNTQPYSGFATLRLTPEDMPTIDWIEMVARRERRSDVLFILGSVLTRSSQYHAVERERGFDAPLMKYLDGYTGMDRFGVRPKGVFFRQNEELDIIRELNTLTRRYTEAKAGIPCEKDDEKRCMNYIDTNLATDLDTSIKRIINGIIEPGKDPEMKQNQSSAQDIKMKAMSHTVSSMKHLTGVVERANNNQSDNKPTSPKKTYSNLKRKTTPKPQTNKRQKHDSFSDDSDDEINEDVPTVEEDNDKTSEKPNKTSEKPNKTSEKPNKTSEKPNKTTEKPKERQELIINKVVADEIDIQIDSLPVLIRSENGDKTIEIEIIDNFKPKTKSVETDLQTRIKNLTDVSFKKVDIIDDPKKYPGSGTENMAQISKIPQDSTNKYQLRDKSEDIATLISINESMKKSTLEENKKAEIINKTLANEDREKALENRKIMRSGVKTKLKRMGILPATVLEQKTRGKRIVDLSVSAGSSNQEPDDHA